MDKDAQDRAFKEHRKEQIIHWARETTWEQRLDWLQAALEFVQATGIDYSAQRQQRVKYEVAERVNRRNFDQSL